MCGCLRLVDSLFRIPDLQLQRLLCNQKTAAGPVRVLVSAERNRQTASVTRRDAQIEIHEIKVSIFALQSRRVCLFSTKSSISFTCRLPFPLCPVGYYSTID